MNNGTSTLGSGGWLLTLIVSLLFSIWPWSG